MTQPVRVPTYLVAQIRSAEAPLLIAGEPLMRRASAALAAIVRDELGDTENPRILVLAGSGDNGGDALYAASVLTGVADVDVVLTGSRAHPEALPVARDAGIRLLDIADVDPSAYTLVIDGMLGIGSSANPTLRGTARRAVQKLLPAVAAGTLTVVAADLPSGVDPDTGTTGDEVVLPAAVTVTFGAVKAGLPSAARFTGRLVLVDLGLPLPDGVGLADVDRYVHVTGM